MAPSASNTTAQNTCQAGRRALVDYLTVTWPGQDTLRPEDVLPGWRGEWIELPTGTRFHIKLLEPVTVRVRA